MVSTIRAAKKDDLDAIMSIENRVHFSPWSQSIMLRYINEPNCINVIERGAVIGYTVTRTIAGEAELLNIAIAPEHQRQGHAQALLEHIITQLTATFIRALFLECRESNHAAITLYEQLGFCLIGTRPNYYPSASGHEDARLYALELSVHGA